MKVSCFLLTTAFFLSLITFGQSKKQLEIQINPGSQPSPAYLDSVTFYNTSDSTVEAAYANVQLKDNKFDVKISQGFYLITIKAKGFNFRKTDYVAVCSLCENKVQLGCFSQVNKNVLLYLPMNSPFYNGGRTALKNDFRNALTEKEISQLSEINQFTIKFFVTKTGELSDVLIEGENLSKREKSLLLKAIRNLKNWNVATVNVNAGDGFVLLKSSELQN